MLFDKNSYERIICFIKKSVSDLFGIKMELVRENVDWNHMEYFEFKYTYIPFDYIIEIKNERGLFTISIIDSEGAQNTLQRIKKFNNSLDEENINNALVILKKILSENKFNLYVFKNDKVYRKSNSQLFRVKNVHDIQL